MAATKLTTGVLALIIGAVGATSALAGGFSRGSADTDILYEDSSGAFRFGGTYVVPGRTYDTISGANATDDRFSDNYVVPNAAVQVRLFDALSCAGTYTQPFGAATTYGNQAYAADLKNTGNGTRTSEFITEEYGATCALKIGAGRGNAYFLGGLFVQNFDYEEATTLGTLHLEDDGQVGYRLGLAYDIPEYAFRTQLMYRSEINHEAEGDFALTPTGSGYIKLLTGRTVPAGTLLPSAGAGTLPKSVEFSIQSGIAEGWLAYGSVEWTDWSVLPALNYSITGLGPQQKVFNFRDGWTIQGGIGHKFNDDISGTINLTWDRGTGTGADLMTDTWTLGAGSQIKFGPGALRLGAGVSYLTSGEQSLAKAASFNATTDGDWAIGMTTSYLIKF